MIRSVLILTKETNKCPNCGHQFKDGEEYCPNCDLFIPVNDQTDQEETFDPNQTKQFKTFKEIEKEPTENYPESRFKHRNFKPEPNNTVEDTTKEDEIDVPEVKVPIEEPQIEEGIVSEVFEVPTKGISSVEDTQTIDPVVPTEEVEEEKISPPTPSTEPTTEELVAKKLESRRESTSSNNRKKLIIGLSAAAVLAVGGFYVYSNEQDKAAEKDRVALINSTEKELDSLFSSKDKVFLKNDIKEADFKKAQEELDKLKTKEGYDNLKELFDEAEGKFNKQEKMNDLFKSPIMVGKELKEDVLVKDVSPITLTRVSEEKDGFDILFNKAFDEAEKQKNQLAAINEKLDQLIKDDSVVKTATRKQYEETEEMIKALKDEDAKKDYLAKLKKVDTYLVDSEKKKQEAEELARQAEEQRLAELNQQNQTNTTTQTIAPTTPTGPGGNYKWGNRQDAYIDYNDAAWGWAPGVQEKVIAEVISRGYVVQGGYTLVPKYIENGEGFYDLYATTNSKIFPKSKPEEFPLYVVTINAKTGWFKGNGPN
jgi:hypothetical protein